MWTRVKEGEMYLTANSINKARDVYRSKIGMGLEQAFRNNVRQPHMDTLVNVAGLLGLRGEPNDVLTGLAPHMEAHCTRKKEIWEADSTEDKQVEHTRKLLRSKLIKAWNMLLRPEDRIIKQFRKAMPPSMLPPPPAGAAEAAAALAMAPHAEAPAQPPALPPPAIQALPAPLTLAPPSPNSYLRTHVQPRSNCDKCAVARGPDASVRVDYATEGANAYGRGKGSGARAIARKRACPLRDHAINSSDGVALLEQYEREYGVKLTKKKQKFEDFMRSENSVERLGKPPSHAVSLYTAPRVDAALALEGRSVKLGLKSVDYEKVNHSKPKDWYAGFMII